MRATIGHLTRRISGIAAAIHGLNRSLEQFDTDQTRLPLKGVMATEQLHVLDRRQKGPAGS